MLIPAAAISVTEINKAKPGHLLLCPGPETTLFWIASTIDEMPYAVFLNGEYAGRAFLAASGSNWEGVQIGPVEIRIDPSSANSDEGLKAADGKLLASVVAKQGGFEQQTRIGVAEIATSGEKTVYFSRWSLGMTCGEDWTEIVKFDGKKASSILLSPRSMAKVAVGGV